MDPTPPRGILPGRILASPTPRGGSPVVGLVPGASGLLVRTADGAAFGYAPDGERALWGAPEERAVFLADHDGQAVILDESGNISLRSADGNRESVFATGLVPDPVAAGNPHPSGIRGEADQENEPEVQQETRQEIRIWTGTGSPAAFFRGVLYFVSGGSLYGFEVASGRRVLEAPLREGRAAAVVPVPTAAPPPAPPAAAEASSAAGQTSTAGGLATSAGPQLPSLLLVSLASGGVAAIGTVAERVVAGMRWRGGDTDPVPGRALVLPEARLVVFGDLGGDLRAVDLESGRQRWRWRLAEGFRHPPTERAGRLYVATEANSLYCYDVRGGERWRTALPGRPAASPIRIGEMLLVVTRDGHLLEFDPTTGIQVGQGADAGAEVVGAVRFLSLANRPFARRLFLGLRDGRLAIFGPAAVARE